jgi:hypothetical protein
LRAAGEKEGRTNSIGEDVVRADSAKEILADLVVGEVELDLDDTHRFGSHHLLNKPRRPRGETMKEIANAVRSAGARKG